jgi:hypothetical protein
MNQRHLLLHRFRFIFSFLLLALSLAPLSAGAAPDAWTPLAPGIDFQIFHLTQPRPLNLFVTRLNRSNPMATIETAIATGSLTSGRQSISGMAARYDQAINYWGETWGNRNRVVAAINGYYFNLSSGEPLSGVIHSGWYAKPFSDYVGDAGFAWNLNGGAFIGRCVYHQARDQFFTVLRSGETRKINGVNVPRPADSLVLYTPQYAASTQTDATGVEVLVEMSRPTMLLPSPARALGTVTRIRDRHGDTPIPFDHVVLSATGSARADLLQKLLLGDEIGISQEISDCPSAPQNYWTKTYAALGGDYHFLVNGVVTIDTDNPDARVPNSRSAVGYSMAYVYFIVADGWNPGVSEGVTVRELGEFARNTLGVTNAVTLDSGGSSTIVINGLPVNNTYCNFTRQCGMSSGGQTREAEKPAEVNPKYAGAVASPDFEPLVGTALLMVAVEPIAQSRVFVPDQTALTRWPSELRLGPGTNYAVQSILPGGASVRIVGMRYKDLNGVLAKGAFWQRVEYSGGGEALGWVRQDDLIWLPPPGAQSVYLPFVAR